MAILHRTCAHRIGVWRCVAVTWQLLAIQFRCQVATVDGDIRYSWVRVWFDWENRFAPLRGRRGRFSFRVPGTNLRNHEGTVGTAEAFGERLMGYLEFLR